MNFSKHLFQLRTQQDWTQQALAARVGISPEAYQNYERGLREPPLSTLVALADAFDLSLDDLVARQRGVRVVTLLENTACDAKLAAAHGLSLYIETTQHKILFDMGPNDDFLANAERLGVDLKAVDLAVLSHGHYDHGGGLAAFCRLNDHAPVYLHKNAFGAYYAVRPELEYIGLPPSLHEFQDRFVFTGDETVIDRELTLFANPPETFAALSASAQLREKVEGELIPDGFCHEQSLLIRSAGKTVLFAGCAHRGIVNILAAAKTRLGFLPDATFGGFHLFQLEREDPASDPLIDAVGRALLPGDTVYYTGHCTGEHAYERLKQILGDRLHAMTGGADLTI